MITYADLDQMLVRLSAQGYEAPAAARQLIESARTIPTPDEVAAGRKVALTEAIASGDAARIAACHQAIVDGQNVSAAWDTYYATRAEVTERIAALVRESVWAFARKRYNDAGERFSKALSMVDPDTAAEDVMLRDKPIREAWRTIPELVSELESGAALLGDIVRQLRNKRYRTLADSKYARFPLGLLVTMNEAHPRRVVEAWCWWDNRNPQSKTELDRVCRGRGGKWAAIVRTGAALAVPCTRLDDYEPFPLAEIFRVGRTVVDPYDSPSSWAAYEAHRAREEQERREHEQKIRAVGGVA